MEVGCQADRGQRVLPCVAEPEHCLAHVIAPAGVVAGEDDVQPEASVRVDIDSAPAAATTDDLDPGGSRGLLIGR